MENQNRAEITSERNVADSVQQLHSELGRLKRDMRMKDRTGGGGWLSIGIWRLATLSNLALAAHVISTRLMTAVRKQTTGRQVAKQVVGRIMRQQPRLARRKKPKPGLMASMIMPKRNVIIEALGLGGPLAAAAFSLARHNRPSSAGRPWVISLTCVFSWLLPGILSVKPWACKANIAMQLLHLAMCYVRVINSFGNIEF